jgi:flagellar basal-body rod protein FlgC
MMSTAMSISASGMTASEGLLNAAASNIANQRSDGPVPTAKSATISAAANVSSTQSVYQPVDAVDISGASGSVSVTYRLTSPAYQLSYQPDSADAGRSWLVAMPNVDPVTQSVNEILSERLFQFNADSLRTASAMTQTAIDLSV